MLLKKYAPSFFIPILGSLLVLGCDAEEVVQSEQVIENPLPTNQSLSRQYELADPECLVQDQRAGLQSIESWHFQGGEAFQQTEPVTGWRGTPILGAAAVAKTYFDFHQMSECTYANQRITCARGAQVVRPKRNLALCDPEGNYPRESVEGVAISALNHLETASEFYGTLDSGVQKLPQANLMVLPKVEKVVEYKNSYGELVKQSVVESDNLAYAPEYEGNPAFIVYPMGEVSERLSIWEGINLWESSWVLAHEYGHHVFRQHTDLTSVQFSKVGTFGELYPPILSRHDHNDTVEISRNAGDSKSHAKRSWAAVNEGFADLYAFYAGGGYASEARYLDCFRASRDVLSSSFTDGEIKRIDAQKMAIFRGVKVQEMTSNDCHFTRFTDVHAMGAIIAHGLHQLFSQFLVNQGVSYGATEMGNLLIKYAQELSLVVSNGQADAVDFDDLLGPALKVVSQGSGLSAGQCSVLYMTFPEHAAAMLQKTGLVCR